MVHCHCTIWGIPRLAKMDFICLITQVADMHGACLIPSHGAFTPKRTKSQFRAGARASSKQVPALSQLWTSWFHTGQSQPWSRREQRHCKRLRFPSNPPALPELYNKKKNPHTSFKHNNNNFVFDSIRVWFVLWIFRFKTKSEKTINRVVFIFFWFCFEA